MTRVSVVIPAYNYARFLGETIQSVLDQTFRDFELIVVDDGSTDNTMEVVSSFKDNRIQYIYQENGGLSSARNTGIKASKGEYIAFLDSDDIWLPENLELKVKLLDSHPDAGLVCSDAYFFDNNTGANLGRSWHDPKRSHHRFDPVRATRQPLMEILRWGFFIGPCATIVRRQVFIAVGYFDESISPHEDWDLFVRIVQHFSIEIIDMQLLKVRVHSTSLSKNQEKMYQGAIATINKVVRNGSLSGSELRLLKKHLALAHSRYGRWALLSGKIAEARKALIAGIRLDPWNIRLYVYLALSFLSTRKILAIKSYKNIVGRQLSRSHLLGGAHYDSSKLLSK
jgi:glycosyltransferase involved in cell wall biosynthesis